MKDLIWRSRTIFLDTNYVILDTNYDSSVKGNYFNVVQKSFFSAQKFCLICTILIPYKHQLTFN